MIQETNKFSSNSKFY